MDERNVVETDGGIAYSTTYDGEADLLDAIVGGIASLEGISVDRVPPLYDAVESEALLSLLRHGQRRGEFLGVEFTVGEYTVSVTNRGRVHFYEDDPVTGRLTDYETSA